MADDLARLFSILRQDPWRSATRFNEEFGAFNSRILEAAHSQDLILNDWLQKYQPCLFGRLAAKAKAITYCVLDENDVQQPDEYVLAKIQDSRLAWSKAAYYANSSAFVILLVSPRIAFGLPDKAMAEFARRLVFLYLRKEIEFDRIYTDEIALEFPGEARLTRLWQTGVNYFCAQGDGRWWQDHRIPGGMALSVNSVGHLVRSGRMQNALELLSRDLDQSAMAGFRIDSLEKALEFAMRTIHMASDGPSGKATRLLPAVSDLPECPVPLPPFLADKNHCAYWGGYHTDVTLPSEYFRPDIKRSDNGPEHTLDFTYLFGNAIENPDFESMGEGRRIRAAAGASRVSRSGEKYRRGTERVVDVGDTVLLKRALGLDT